jgi:hypothetical protein
MKKTIFLLLCLSTFTLAQNDFRKFNWGDDIKKIKNLEKSELVSKEKEMLAFYGSLAAEDVLIKYDFADGKLCIGSYLFRNKYSSVTDNLKLYEKLKADLSSKYGALIGGDEKWYNDTFRFNSSLKEMAILSGHLEYNGHWENDRTQINLVLKKGKEYKSDLILIYRSKILYQLWFNHNQPSNEL